MSRRPFVAAVALALLIIQIAVVAEAASSGESFWNFTLTDVLIVVVTSIYTLVTAAYVAISYHQWRVLRDTLDLSRDTTQRQLRAYVFAASGELWNVKPGLATPHSSPEEQINVIRYKDKGPMVRVTIKNFGLTPAYDVNVWVRMCLADYPNTPQLPEIPLEAYGYQTILAPGNHVEHVAAMDTPLTDADRSKIQEGAMAIYIYGAVSFMDAFDAKVVSHFLFVHGPHQYGTRELSPANGGTVERRE